MRRGSEITVFLSFSIREPPRQIIKSLRYLFYNLSIKYPAIPPSSGNSLQQI
jgi:hypothetical protein